jgi:hypothetical protein
MPCSRPVAESAVVQVLLIDTFTHTGTYPAYLSERVALQCYYSTETAESVVKMDRFEFNIELLISVTGARPLLWNKTVDTYKDRIDTKKAWRRVCTCLQEDFQALGMLKKLFW